MKQYIVDAFTDKVFSGNPAAVCIMENWLDDDLMHKIAMENNLSETAFAVKKEDNRYKLRWFTPGGEIDLCGHATLATAYVIMNFIDKELTVVTFETLSGDLVVRRNKDLFEMDFPAYKLKPVEITSQMIETIGTRPVEAFMGRDLLCVLEDEEMVRNFSPDAEKIKKLEGLLLHLTAPGKEYDCVSRSFAPKLNVLEDPVCGSGHCHIAPYWVNVLKKDVIVANQASKRGGVLYCRVSGDKIFLSGKAALFSVSEIFF